MSNPTPTPPAHVPHNISDEHLGAVEGDRDSDTQEGNLNAARLNEDDDAEGAIATAEDVIGANSDETQG